MSYNYDQVLMFSLKRKGGRFMNAGIIGIGKYVPKKVLTNVDLEKVLDTSDEWIRTRTGIEARHIAAEDEETSDLAYEAAKNALEHLWHDCRSNWVNYSCNGYTGSKFP